MVDVIKLKIERKNDNKKKIGNIILLSVVFLYLIVVVTTIAIVGLFKNKEKVGIIGTGGYEGSNYCVQVVFYDLNVGSGSFEVKARDFVIETDSGDIRAICFEGGATTYKINKKSSKEIVKVMFPRIESIISSYYVEVEYRDEELEIARINTMAEILVPIVTIETLIFFFIFSITLIIIKNIVSLNSHKKIYKETNGAVVKELAARGFKSTKVFYMPSPRTGTTNMEKLVLCIDKNNNKLAFVDYANKECIIANASDVVKYSVIENNGVGMKQTTALTLFDIPYTTTESYNLCNKLQLVIVLDSEEKTNVIYEFVKGGVRQNSEIYSKMSSMLIEVTSTLEIMTGGVKRDKMAFVKCKYCGAKNNANNTRCESCGSNLD